MEKKKRRALEAAGFRVGDAHELLGLNAEERRFVELRVTISDAIRRLREKNKLTQEGLAVKLQSSQSRVAKMESGAPGVSFDLLFRGLFAVGGDLADLERAVPPVGQTRRRPARRAKKHSL